VLRQLVNLIFAASVVSSTGQAGPIRDPGFETEGATGQLDAWKSCGSVAPVLQHATVLHGRTAVAFGSDAGGEIAGDSGICQRIVIPMARRVYLDYWARALSTETDAKHAFAWAAFFDGTDAPDMSTPYLMLFHDIANTNGGFEHYTFDITELQGQTLFLSFGVHGDGNPAAHTSLVLDDVSLQMESPRTNGS
jgi:hypothetical protein